MTISANFPTSNPSLLLDFVNEAVLDPRITFTRSVPAVYYDNHTSTLAEQNLLLYSNTFTNAAWVATNGTVASGVTDPAGGTTAFSFTASSANGTLYQTLTLAATPYTLSLYIQRVTGTGTINLTLDGTNFTAVSITGSWVRYTTTVTPAAGSRTIGIQVTTSGDVVNIYGAQLEQRSTVTAYNLTTTSQVVNYIPTLQTAAINVPRFDYNPVTRQATGLLIEQQSTNLNSYSGNLTNAAWTTTNASVTLDNIAPDGTLSAADFTEATGTVSPRATNAGFSNGTYCTSFYIKAKSGSATRYVYIGAHSGGLTRWAYYIFNPVDGSVQGSGFADGVQSTASSPLTTSVGNGWYRISMVWQTYLDGFTVTIGLTNTTTPTNNYTLGSYTGDGFSGVYIWGAQTEANVFPSSYIATTTASTVRTADLAAITGTNFSSWYAQTQGTLYAEGTVNGNISSSSSALVEINNNTQATYVVVVSTGTYVVNTLYKGGVAYSGAGASAGYLNGVSSISGGQANAQLFATQLQIGIGRIYYAWGYRVKKIAYYPVQLTAAQLQNLTLS
jgi:hypothetical protein